MVVSCASVRAARERLGDPEIRDDGGSAGEEHVVGLDVAMHDAALVRVRQSARDVAEHAHRFRNRQRTDLAEPLAQGRPSTNGIV